MTCDSIDSRPMRVRRAHSRSTSLRASSGRSSASSLARSSFSAVVAAALALAELLLDRLQLLAQVHLALAAAELFLDLRLDVLLRREHVDLALDVDEHAAQAVLDRERLEQGLLLGDRDVEVAGDEVGEAAGLVDLARGSARRPRRAGRASCRARAARSRTSRWSATNAGSFASSGEHLAAPPGRSPRGSRSSATTRSAMPRDLPSSTRRMPPRPRWTEPSVAIVPIV